MFSSSEKEKAILLLRKGVGNSEILRQLSSDTATLNDINVLKYRLKNKQFRVIGSDRLKEILAILPIDEQKAMRTFLTKLIAEKP